MKPREPDPVNLVVSVFTGDTALFAEAFKRLTARFGPIEALGEATDFGGTDYYTDEFGAGLKRRVASFERLVASDSIASIKLFTNGLEDVFSSGGKRRVNIDPGYMALEKFVLSSCKNFSHRIHAGMGVYAETTLQYSDGDFRPLPWTYPDYAAAKMKSLLTEVRRRYAFKLGRGLRVG